MYLDERVDGVEVGKGSVESRATGYHFIDYLLV